jgi:hypothetical protein
MATHHGATGRAPATRVIDSRGVALLRNAADPPSTSAELEISMGVHAQAREIFDTLSSSRDLNRIRHAFIPNFP